MVRDSFSSQLGTAYSIESTAKIAARNHAIARMLDAAWGTNARLANLRDPSKLYGKDLERWERMLAIFPPQDASEEDRRAEVALRRNRAGQNPNRTIVRDELVRVLGDVLVELYYVPIGYAVIHTPDSTYPFGSVSDGAPWYSTVKHLCILTQNPTGYSDGDFYAAVGKIAQTLDPIIPATTTFSWYRAPSVGTPIDVPSGPQQTGFYLDERNLDWLAFAPFPHPGVAGFFLDVSRNLNHLTFS